MIYRITEFEDDKGRTMKVRQAQGELGECEPEFMALGAFFLDGKQVMFGAKIEAKNVAEAYEKFDAAVLDEGKKRMNELACKVMIAELQKHKGKHNGVYHG